MNHTDETAPAELEGLPPMFHNIRSALEPSQGSQARVLRRVQHHLRAARLLEHARTGVTPDASVLHRLWARIAGGIDPLRTLSLWQRLQQTLSPSDHLAVRLWSTFSARLEPRYAHAFVSQPVKWVAAVAIVVLTVRISPLLFLAPATVAQSSVTLFTENGNVEVLLGSLWQPMGDELTLQSPVRVQTQSGQASIVDHDDAVFRLAPHTRIAMLDLSNRPEPAAQETTLALETGTLWVLGLVPRHIRGVVVVTSQGRVHVHEGSVSITDADGVVTLDVLNRGAVVSRHGKQLSLVAGESAVLSGDADMIAQSIASSRFQEPWVAVNLSRDAAHQREIAQLQQERRAANAGILPGSTLYPVKRLAEQVEVLLSFSEEERARKLITQANTRLNEAAALLQHQETTAAQSALQEYKDTLLHVASGSGSNQAVQNLLEKEVVEAGPAAVSAALPGDDAYALKQIVVDTIAALPVEVAKPDEGEALLDQLAALKRQAEQGDTELAREKLSELSDSLESLNVSGSLTLLSPEVRQEAKAAAEQVAAVVEGPVEGVGLTLGVPAKEEILPRHPSHVVRYLTPEQVVAKAQEIRGRIFVFGTKKAQYDALEDQLSLLNRHPDRGSILRELSKVLPRNGLAQMVLREIRTVQLQVEKQVTASGGTRAAQ
jgi:hypothetical protein